MARAAESPHAPAPGDRMRRRRTRSTLVAVLATALLAGATWAAPSSGAAGPSTLGVSSWEVFSNTTLYTNTGGARFHGNPDFYDDAPAIPAASDPGWAECGPNSPMRTDW